MAFLFNTSITPLTLNNMELTDLYHITDVTSPSPIVKDLIFPNSRGRQMMPLGAEMDDTSSLTVTFQSEGEFLNMIYAETYQDYWALYEDIIELLYDTNTLMTLKCYLFPTGAVQENMRITFNPIGGPPRPRSIKGEMVIVQPFVMKAAKYRA